MKRINGTFIVEKEEVMKMMELVNDLFVEEIRNADNENIPYSERKLVISLEGATFYGIPVICKEQKA